MIDWSPRIFDVAELPEEEKGRPCPLYVGDNPSHCGEPSEFVFVYEANIVPDDDTADNCLCCPDCKPEPESVGGGSA